MLVTTSATNVAKACSKRALVSGFFKAPAELNSGCVLNMENAVSTCTTLLLGAVVAEPATLLLGPAGGAVAAGFVVAEAVAAGGGVACAVAAAGGGVPTGTDVPGTGGTVGPELMTGEREEDTGVPVADRGGVDEDGSKKSVLLPRNGGMEGTGHELFAEGIMDADELGRVPGPTAAFAEAPLVLNMLFPVFSIPVWLVAGEEVGRATWESGRHEIRITPPSPGGALSSSQDKIIPKKAVFGIVGWSAG